jgi:hypothetical protein
VRRAHRPRRHARVQGRISGLLPVLQRHQGACYGTDFGSLLLFQGHSRLDAYAAVQTGDAKLAARAWEKFYTSDGYQESAPWRTEKASGPVTTVAGSEANWVHTNDTALYGLAAIENLVLLGDRMPA